MAYSVSLPPNCIAMGPGGGAKGKLWMYHSTDVHTDVDGASYFEDGHSLGMRVGDVVFVVETDNSYALSIHVVTAVTTGGAATVSVRVTA